MNPQFLLNAPPVSAVRNGLSLHIGVGYIRRFSQRCSLCRDICADNNCLQACYIRLDHASDICGGQSNAFIVCETELDRSVTVCTESANFRDRV